MPNKRAAPKQNQSITNAQSTATLGTIEVFQSSFAQQRVRTEPEDAARSVLSYLQPWLRAVNARRTGQKASDKGQIRKG